MTCSHYEVYAYDSQRNMVACCVAYSFEEAYYYIDIFRNRFKKAVEFSVRYPYDEIMKMTGGENNEEIN